jgi:Mitochondrial 18 KDa protein (MTP18)
LLYLPSASMAKPALSKATRFEGNAPFVGYAQPAFYGQPAAPAASTFNANLRPNAFVTSGHPVSGRPSFQTAYQLAAPAPSTLQAYGGVTTAFQVPIQATLQQSLPTTRSGMPSSALQGATLFNQSPEVEPLRASASKPLLASHSKHETAANEEYVSVLKKTPWRFIGFMNEVAQAVGKKILGPLYAMAWGGEFIYMGIDGALDAKHRAKVTEGTPKQKNIMAAKEFVATVGVFQTLATIILPNLVIDSAKEMAEKVITSKVAAKGIAGISKEAIHKWAPVALGLALIPPIVKVMDPTIEFASDVVARPLLGLPQREGSHAEAILKRFHHKV